MRQPVIRTRPAPPQRTGLTSHVNSLTVSGVSGQAFFNFTYGSSHNLTGVVLPTGGSSTASYNNSRHPHLPSGVRDFATAEADPLTWAYAYDSNGYLIQAQNSAEGIAFRFICSIIFGKWISACVVCAVCIAAEVACQAYCGDR